MIKLITKIVITILLLLTLPASAFAKEPNNKFGIHVFDENDLPEAAALVNSSGGEWGYVTVVIREDERNTARWQSAFDQMRRLKLIPIVRIATTITNSHWEIPTKEEAVNWASFLNSLNWPVKTRYVVLFNEPNHAKEWGGAIDPAGFSEITRHYYETINGFSEDFFVMAGALDLAANNSKDTMEASVFFERMHTKDNFIFTIFDGLASHSYPNPGFSGSVNDSGKTSIKGYIWELDYLSSFGMESDIPVFITETGWINSAGNLEENYKTAFEGVWSDSRIIAVTPFLLSYTAPPFDVFSWKNPETTDFYPQYYFVQSMAKQKGMPAQRHSFEFVEQSIADYLVSDSEYSFAITLKNTGQSIWSTADNFTLKAASTMQEQNLIIAEMPVTEPTQSAKIPVRLVTDEPRGIHSINFSFYKGEEKIADVVSTKFTLVSPPSVNIEARFMADSIPHVSLDMFDEEILVTHFENLTFVDNQVSIAAIKGVIPNKNYKFILSKPYYLSVGREARLLVGTTNINFGRLLPVDFGGDGKFNLQDLAAYSASPLFAAMHIFAKPY